jgi:oligoribonuclease NrnB/cAMP/cGMP phosphodiesterase (DHH superfamily)
MICIYHSKDLDGWTSAAIVKSKYIDAKLIGYNYGGHLPEIKDGEPIIIVDVCFSMEYMEKLARKSRWNLKWIDHHISQIKEYKNFIGDGETFMNAILPQQDENVAACELTWRHFYPNIPIPEAIRLLGRYDCFGHKGTDEEQKIFLF